MGFYRVKGWARFQHYKGRRPPWIKLYRELLDDFEYLTLDLASMALAPCLWLLASESDDGTFSDDPSKLMFRLRRSQDEIIAGLRGLERSGFVTHEGEHASALLASCLQETPLETEERRVETEREGEESVDAGASATPSKVARFTRPTLDEVKAFISENGYRVDADRFMAYYESNGWKVGRNPMKDWRAAIRGTWAKGDSSSTPAKVAARSGSTDATRGQILALQARLDKERGTC